MTTSEHPSRLARSWLAGVIVIGIAVTGGGVRAAASPPAAERTAVKHCALPAAGESFERATPAEVHLDEDELTRAVDYLSTRNRLSVQVFRNNCLVATGPLDPVTAKLPNNTWSVTKSVVSMITGIAIGDGKLRLDDAIGNYLPDRPGWGGAAHRAITVRQLLTQTSGLRESILAEAATTATDPSLPREALAQPFRYQPGKRFQYSQLGPALLAYVVQRAVGEDLQRYAQRELFDKIGIEKNSYLWLRDRSGMTYGYSNLFMRPPELARLGLLMQNDGRWNSRQVIPTWYVAAAHEPTSTNGCYGFLFWTNSGEPCIGANIPAAQKVPHRAILSAPRDAYEMNGTAGQLDVMIPSLDMTVTTTGLFGDHYPDPSVLLGAIPGDMQHEFFRRLMRAVTDKHIPDPGPYPGKPIDLDINPMNYAHPGVLLTDLFPSPRCNVVLCDGGVPFKGVDQNLKSLVRLLGPAR